MQLIVNGEPRRLATSLSIEALLAELHYRGMSSKAGSPARALMAWVTCSIWLSVNAK